MLYPYCYPVSPADLVKAWIVSWGLVIKILENGQVHYSGIILTSLSLQRGSSRSWGATRGKTSTGVFLAFLESTYFLGGCILLVGELGLGDESSGTFLQDIAIHTLHICQRTLPQAKRKSFRSLCSTVNHKPSSSEYTCLGNKNWRWSVFLFWRLE